MELPHFTQAQLTTLFLRDALGLYRAINSRVFHETFLALGVGRQLKYCEHHRNHQPHTRNLQESGPTG